ncbi:ABC transporter ATP-binding protein [Nocardia sp. NBC_01329]|uniref:ABC transporter ATP-binding protein n=1 Tax=Nocardia sp. NBC_01329 TaxID=2903594 RepID=UPI002E132EBE|nr:ABC transporter ATP-binding protein [Nocardia sp. NBC_01329]
MNAALSEPAVEMSAVSQSFDEMAVLEDFSLTVNRGEFVSLVGPSGCGKSTILNLIAGFAHPTRGTVRAGGRPVTHPGPDRGVCFQQAALFPWLSVVDNVTFGPRARHELDPQRRARAVRMLQEFGLGEFLRHRPAQLSGGMQQRAAIARVLVNEPDVLLMDEPFGALDAQTRLRMQRFLTEVQDEFGCTIVFITHDIDEALLMSDRVLVLSRRPAHVVDEIVVEAPRPRTPDYLLTEDFRRHKARAFTALESLSAERSLGDRGDEHA